MTPLVDKHAPPRIGRRVDYAAALVKSAAEALKLQLSERLPRIESTRVIGGGNGNPAFAHFQPVTLLRN